MQMDIKVVMQPRKKKREKAPGGFSPPWQSNTIEISALERLVLLKTASAKCVEFFRKQVF